MTDQDSKSSTTTRRLLSSIRDVLFDNTSQPPGEVSAKTTLSALPAPAAVEAARAVLRAAVEAELGPGIREFSLQDEALSDALPDPTARRRAVLRVLALKGTTRQHLCLELEQALATLGMQQTSFAQKLGNRREALLAAQRAASEQCTHDTSDAEQAIQRLTAELEAQRVLITAAQAQRDEANVTSEASLAELDAREQSFRIALHEVESAYLGLKTQLSQEPV